MAGEDRILSPNPQFNISRHQYEALLASHKAFRDVAIRITDILQDPSRTSYYQSLPSEAEDDTDPNYAGYGQNVPKGDSSISRQQTHQYECKTAPDETITNSAFELENTRAKKAYKQKRQRSINLFASTSVSYLDTEYDFQCISTS